MRKCRIWAIAASLLLIIALLGMPYPLAYKVEGVTGYVLDEDTGRPLEDVTVVVAWSAKAGFFTKSHSSGWFAWQYGKTDERGHFAVPGIKRHWRKWFSSRRLSDHGPHVALLKAGYVTVSTSAPALAHGREAYSDQEPRMIAAVYGIVDGFTDITAYMKNLPSDPKMRYEAFHNVFSFNRFIVSERDCRNEQFLGSGFALQIFREQAAALEAGLPTALSDVEATQLLNSSMNEVEASIFMCHLIRSGSIKQQF